MEENEVNNDNNNENNNRNNFEENASILTRAASVDNFSHVHVIKFLVSAGCRCIAHIPGVSTSNNFWNLECVLWPVDQVR